MTQTKHILIFEILIHFILLELIHDTVVWRLSSNIYIYINDI